MIAGVDLIWGFSFIYLFGVLTGISAVFLITFFLVKKWGKVSIQRDTEYDTP